MTTSTLYEIDEHITVNGENKRIISVHIYISPKKHTERYYFGNGEWLTIKRD